MVAPAWLGQFDESHVGIAYSGPRGLRPLNQPPVALASWLPTCPGVTNQFFGAVFFLGSGFVFQPTQSHGSVGGICKLPMLDISTITENMHCNANNIWCIRGRPEDPGMSGVSNIHVSESVDWKKLRHSCERRPQMHLYRFKYSKKKNDNNNFLVYKGTHFCSPPENASAYSF